MKKALPTKAETNSDKRVLFGAMKDIAFLTFAIV